MNTVKSFWLGWGAVTVAGVGAYVVAKKQINADRQAKLHENRQNKHTQRSMEHADKYGSSQPMATSSYSSSSSSTTLPSAATTDNASTSSISQESGSGSNRQQAPAAADSQDQGRVASSAAYRSPKGDRFS